MIGRLRGWASRYYSETRSPMGELTRHFFQGLFQPESSAGEDSFTNWIGQVLAILITASWFIPVQLFRRYSELHGLSDPKPYRIAYASDSLSALVLMMLLVGVLTVLEWPALFPSRRDHLVLTPLPLTRVQLFGAKLAALLLFVTLFIGAITLFCSMALPAIASGQWEPRSVWLRALAWLAGSVSACYFVFLLLLGFQGVLLMALPLRWFEPASFAAQMLLLVALLAGFPLFFYFPAHHLIGTQSAWLEWIPGAWFWGLSEWLLGSRGPLHTSLAMRALVGLSLACVVAATSYLVSYLRYNRYALEVSRPNRKPRFEWANWFGGLFGSSPARATAEFITCTIARGRRQKMVFLTILGMGLALLIESTVYIGLRLGNPGFESNSRIVESSIVALPLTLSLFAMVGLRRSFRVAIELPANWLFRFAECLAWRRQQMDAVFFTFVVVGGLPPLIVCAPLEFAALGYRAFWAFPLQFLLMLTLAEHLLAGWCAIPFTFSSDPARRHVIHSAILHLFELAIYSFASSTWIRIALRDPNTFWRFGLILLAAFSVLRYRRLKDWGSAPLEFAEAVHAQVEPLQLSPE